ncbi:MAG: hypothetical protein JKX76_15475 [Colwellia sp.]|nr:hypothetical protein [Colwellia sp.]
MKMDHKNYLDMRDEIKSGDIVAWQGRFTNSNVLKFFNQDIGHIGIAWVVSDRVFVIHALTKGIVMNPLSRLTPFCWLATGSEWREETQRFALSELGRSYSYGDAIRSAFGMASASSGWACGEYARAVLQKSDLHVTQDLPSKLVNEVLALDPNRKLVKLF